VSTNYPGATRRGFLRAALAAVPLTTAAVHGAEQKKAKKICPACKGTGRIPCRVHTYSVKGRFRIACSLCGPLKCCGGLGWRPCKKCKDEAAQAEWDEAFKEWQAERKHDTGYPDMFGDALKRAAVRHFHIQGPFTHAQFHDYADKFERCHAYFLEIFGEDAEEHLPWKRCQIGIYGRQMAYGKYVRKIADQGGGHEQRMWVEMALKAGGLHQSHIPRTVRFKAGKPDKQIQHSIVHSLGHIYTDTYRNQSHPPAWLGEGFAGHCERVIMGQPQTYCIAYGGTERKGALHWASTLTQAIKTRKLKGFEELSKLRISDMNANDWAQSIGVVELLVLKPKKFVPLLMDLKNDKSASATDAIKKHYGLNLKKFEALWRKNFRRIR